MRVSAARRWRRPTGCWLDAGIPEPAVWGFAALALRLLTIFVWYPFLTISHILCLNIPLVKIAIYAGRWRQRQKFGKFQVREWSAPASIGVLRDGGRDGFRLLYRRRSPILEAGSHAQSVGYDAGRRGGNPQLVVMLFEFVTEERAITDKSEVDAELPGLR